MTTRARYYTPQELAELYGISVNKIIGWIHDGSLRAIDVSQRRGQRPRWRISPDALAAFEAGRTLQPPVQASRRRRRADPRVIEFFK